MTAGTDVDRLLWAVAEARQLRNEQPVHPGGTVNAWRRDPAPAETEFATDWQQPTRYVS